MKFGKLQPQGKVEFDGYQELMNWTSAGSESSVSLSVDGDTDMEYVIEARDLTAGNDSIRLRLNNDSTAGIYGRQFLYNNAGTISSGRDTDTSWVITSKYSNTYATISTINGFIKFYKSFIGMQTSIPSTAINEVVLQGCSYNSTSNITSLVFFPHTGNFTAGTNIRVLGRRAR